VVDGRVCSRPFRFVRGGGERHEGRGPPSYNPHVNSVSNAARPLASAPGNLILVGLMGAGKTSVGRLLAKRFGKTFYDCDQEIERRTGVKIPVIFDIEGEEGFRARETSVLRELTALDDVVLATGGGAVVRAENRALLAQSGTVLYLRASMEDLWLRTRHDRNRPLLQTGNPRAKLEQLFIERDPLYREIAALIVDTGNQSVRSLMVRLEQKLAEHFVGDTDVAKALSADVEAGRDQ
jgi:shikimate kinase